MDTAIAEFLARTASEEVVDVEEEAFYLFSQEISTPNLGFVDSRAPTLDVQIGGNEYTVHQSPSLLSSSRAGGTTGAVLWKITPCFAEWISSPSNPLWTHSLLSEHSVVAELGCGISALVALALSPSVHHYLATDQEYVRRLFRTNIEANSFVSRVTPAAAAAAAAAGKSKGSKPKHSGKPPPKGKPIAQPSASNITFTTLDWEHDQPARLKACIRSESTGRGVLARDEREKVGDDEDLGFDLLLSCDCVYNDALVAPFVRTCAEICRLRPCFGSRGSRGPQAASRPTVCIVAQQQRAPDVFETWLRETLREFRVWRLSDEVLGDRLKGGTGYLVHLLLARADN
ncbi:Uncharacterized protein PECH_005101 [Penicillium ucsense]|uniref:Diaminohydroxyphosphoribosylamino-pyrimidine deaminase n=1 Tax=Penicillium ucsense TaxID=2839758 RepID=A0A8J8W361_9EURO|nr:Uncharacterized protein PECM_005923 [Penicillium ucsense]KAF7736594.1 Uncharacterized protein PECH_005101 [Penicillium ucsense]